MKKKFVIIIISTILSIFVTLNISLGIAASNYDTYTIKMDEGDKLEVVIINDTEMPIDRYVSEWTILEEDEKKDEDVVEAIEDANVTIMVTKIDSVYIKTSGQNVKIYCNDELLELNEGVYYKEIGFLPTIRIGIEWYSILIFAIAMPFMYMIILRLIDFARISAKDEIKFLNILEFIALILILYIMAFYALFYILRWYSLVLILCVCCYYVYYLNKADKLDLEKVFIVLGTVAGISLIFLIPPFNIPDEGAHFVKSYFVGINGNDDNGNVVLPESINNFSYKYIHGSYVYTIKYNVKNYFNDLFDSLSVSSSSDEIFDYSNTNSLSVVPYLPSVVAITIARALRMSPLFLIIFGRFSNLLISLLIGYYSIKEIPAFKGLIFVMLLLPIVMQQTMGINMDWLTNIMSVAIVAYVIRLKYRQVPITNKNMVLLAGMVFILAFCKFGYFPIAFLVLLIPNKNFETKYKAILFKAFIILMPIVLGIIQNIGTILIPSTGTSKYYSFGYALHHPFDIVKVYLSTLKERVFLDLFTGMLDGFGISLKWGQSSILTGEVILVLLLILSYGFEDKKLKVWDKIIIAISAIMIYGIVYTSLCFTWTPQGAENVQGLQCRYFIPANLLIFMLLSNNKIKLKVKNKNLVFAFCMILVYFLAFYTISNGFY